jgi:hypothetical protein
MNTTCIHSEEKGGHCPYYDCCPHDRKPEDCPVLHPELEKPMER